MGFHLKNVALVKSKSVIKKGTECCLLAVPTLGFTESNDNIITAGADNRLLFVFTASKLHLRGRGVITRTYSDGECE